MSIISDKDYFMYNINKMLDELPDDFSTLNNTQLQEFLDESKRLSEDMQQFENLQNFDDLNKMFDDMQKNLQLTIDNQILKDKKTDFLLRESHKTDSIDLNIKPIDEDIEDNLPGVAGGLIGPLNKGLNKFF